MAPETPSHLVDLAFALAGEALPRDHRRELAQAIALAWPGWSAIDEAGVHRLNVAAGGGPQALLSQRTRLTLRVPRERVAEARTLEGAELQVGGARLRLGAAQARELRPHGTLYAHLVAAEPDAEEADFLERVAAELSTLGVAGRPICGRLQVVEAGTLRGYGLMLDGLDAAGALRILEAGIGRHRDWGCGVFVPHKSAVAVGR